MDKVVKEKHAQIKSSDNKNNFVERDEDEMPVLSGAVLHVLSSNGLTNCDSAKCGVIQKGKIIKNNEMGKKKNDHAMSFKQKGEIGQNTVTKNHIKQDQKINGLDGIDDDDDDDHDKKKSCTHADLSNNLTTKIQNGGSAQINGLATSPGSSPVKLEEQYSACGCDKPINGDIKQESSQSMRNTCSPKNQVVRPKSISWSRMVKQRKENKMKERNGKRSNKSNKGYIYPELCSSSEESSDENVKSINKIVQVEENGENTEHSIKHLCNESLKLYGNNIVSNDMESLVTTQQLKPARISLNGENGLTKVEQTDFSTLGAAPLAVPEDSDTGRSSISSSSDGKINDSVIENNITESGSRENLQINFQSGARVENIAIEAPNNILDNRELERNILPMFRNPSIDSLEEIGDYIETDFPSKASRLLFQSSSRSSSPSTDDEDEGYGVNKDKKQLKPDDVIEQSFNPVSFPHNSTSLNINSENLKLKIDQNVPSLCQRPNFENVSHAAHRIARLSSGAGSESEKGGIMGSDSSYVYTPETDYQEFIDSDLPSSEVNNQYVGNNDRDYVMSQLENYAEEFIDSDSNLGHSNQFVGAEGGATNNLNLEGRRLAFDYIDSNMEVYDPHCDQPDDDNYLLRVIYKHEKVPIANFQNSESNKQEKIFCKLAIDGDNPVSSLSGSSDEEENAFHHFSRDVVPNLASNSEPQNTDCTDCMGVEDLENLTHALQNAVIMHLPSRLEESSG